MENPITQRVKPEGERTVDNKSTKATEIIEKAISATKTSSKIHKSLMYEKAMMNPLHF